MAIKPTTEFINYQTPSNPINPIVDTGGYRGDPVTDWYKKIVDDKILDKIKDKIKDNYTDWYSQYTGNDNGGGDNGGYVDNPIAVQQPEEQVAETPVVEATTPAVEKTAAETEVTNPIAETETAAETEKETEPAADIATQDVDQRNDAFINNAVGSQDTDKGKESSATDWYDDAKQKEIPTTGGQPNPSTQPISGNLVGTNIEIPEDYSTQEAKSAVGDFVSNFNKNTQYNVGNKLGWVLKNIINTVTKNGIPTPTGNGIPFIDTDTSAHRYTIDLAGNLVRLEPGGGGLNDFNASSKAYIQDPITGEWIPAVYDYSTNSYQPVGNPISTPSTTTPTVNNAETTETGMSEPTASINNEGAQVAEQTATDNPINTSPDNPYTDPDWVKAYEVGLLRGNPSTPLTLNTISDVQIGDKAVHYVDDSGAIHSVPITTDKGQEISDYFGGIDPGNVRVDDSYVGYFDEEGHYHTVDLSSGRGQQIENYVDEIKDDYRDIEGAYAKAISMVNEDYADTNYSPNGTQGDPIYASIMSDGMPAITGYETEEEINYQDYILQNFVISGYDNKVNADGKEWNLVIPEGCEDIIASDKEHANDPKRNDNIETVYMTEEEYKEKVNKFIDANPQLAKLIESNKVTVDGIVANFLKALYKGNGGSGYRSGGYGGYYRGGGGGYRSYGGSSGGSSNSAGSTTQNQQRVYNIMKNWSF
jgi:hypothetical protein